MSLKTYAERLKKHREQGVCVKCASKPATPPFKTCSRCRENVRRQQAARRAEWRANGYRADRRPWRKFAAPCVICGFEFSDVHHRRGKAAGDGPDNLVSLCPNHHRMLHMGLLSLI